MNILLVNWQDPRNPQAGGAEIHLREIFRRLSARGHRITWLASGWRGSPDRDLIDGIEIRRVGGRYTFGVHAHRTAGALLATERFDLLVEALNKVPVFTPLWAPVPTVLLVHHLFGTTAFREASAPLAAATWLLERPLGAVYRGVPVQAISQSTADDLVARGLRDADIQVIHPGVDLAWFRPGPTGTRAAEPTFVYIGRLKRYKRVDLIVRAVAELASRGVAVQLRIAGRGDREPQLRVLADRLGIADRVEFLGYVSEARKRELFQQAWANVFTSPKEGWGITNIEAAACGTPSVAADAPGLRESVVSGRTGLLVPVGEVRALADAIATLALDLARVEALGRGARAFAESLSWDAAADRTEAHLAQSITTRALRHSPSRAVEQNACVR